MVPHLRPVAKKTYKIGLFLDSGRSFCYQEMVEVGPVVAGMSGTEFHEALASLPLERRPVAVVNSARRRS
jgi:hypothetical protein